MSIIKRFFPIKEKPEIDQNYSHLIFDLYYQSAYNSAYKYCGDALLSEEAAQEAIFKAIQNLDQLQDPDKIEAWIKKIAVNNVRAAYNKNKKVVSLEVTAPIIDSFENGPEFIFDSQETREAVNRIVQTLDPFIKQIIHLHYYEQVKVREIAQLLEKPEGTIKTALYKGRNIIKNQLIKEGHMMIGPKGGVIVE
ncbi:MAG: RNA polymerase sigma factor [Bacillota bacterium]